MTSRGLRLAALSVIAVSLSACALPRSGPNKREILAGTVEQKGDAFVVPVTPAVARLADDTTKLGFSKSFITAGEIGSDTIAPGDILMLTIWENVDDGLMSIPGTNATTLTEVQVDGSGNIFVPYAGRIHAAGNSPEAVRRLITEKLAGQTPDPQVQVVRKAGDGTTVSLSGAVGAQGVYPIERPTRTLSAMLARAGGLTIPTEIAQVTVIRGSKSEKVWYRDIFTTPSYDIALRGGDRVLVEEDSRSFTTLGAAGSQTRVKFQTQTLTAIEALAQVGGLSTAAADPTGIFVFRDERQDIARAVLGRPDLAGPQKIIYVLNLTEPGGVFTARDFMIRDGDTIYVTEAPFVQWSKVLGALTGTLNTANSVDSLARTGS